MSLFQVYRPVSTEPSAADIRSHPMPASLVPQAWRTTSSPSLFFMTTFSVSWLWPSSIASMPVVCARTSA